jgi:protein-disulfide isomerase
MREKGITIDCYLSPGCGSEAALRENIARALALEKLDATMNVYRIDDAKALALGLTGSPSVFIDGKELQPQGQIGFS